MWFVAILALIGVTLTIIASLIPLTGVGPGHGGGYIAFQSNCFISCIHNSTNNLCLQKTKLEERLIINRRI